MIDESVLSLIFNVLSAVFFDKSTVAILLLMQFNSTKSVKNSIPFNEEMFLKDKSNYVVNLTLPLLKPQGKIKTFL